MPVPNRFFGVFEDGSLKVRGIEARRHDIPPYIRNVQGECLDMLARAGSLEECRRLLPDLTARLAECEDALARGEVPRDQLLVTQSLSRAPEEYTSNAMIAIAARQATMAGINLRAGQSVSYLITSRGDADVMRRVCLAALLQAETTYDATAYRRLLRRAFQSLLQAFGVALDEEPETPPKQRRKRTPIPDADLFTYLQHDHF